MNFLKKFQERKRLRTNLSQDAVSEILENEIIDNTNPKNEEILLREDIKKIYESIEKINKKYKKPSGFISRSFSTISGNILLIGILGGA